MLLRDITDRTVVKFYKYGHYTVMIEQYSENIFESYIKRKDYDYMYMFGCVAPSMKDFLLLVDGNLLKYIDLYKKTMED